MAENGGPPAVNNLRMDQNIVNDLTTNKLQICIWNIRGLTEEKTDDRILGSLRSEF